MSYFDHLRHLPTKMYRHDIDKKLIELATTQDNLDESVARELIDEPFSMEKKILNYIVERFNLHVNVEYLYRATKRDNGARTVSEAQSPQTMIFMDEISDHSIRQMYFTVFTAYYNKAKFDICREYFHVLIHEFLRSLTDEDMKSRNIHIEDVTELGLEQASDLYWTTWTFMVGHELYHVQHPSDIPSFDDEYAADEYGYSILIQMIDDRRKGLLPEGLDCFYEEFYLAPCALMYLLKIIYESNEGKSFLVDSIHPEPGERMQRIIDLCDTLVPDDLDTSGGNAMLQTFMDIVDGLMSE